MNTVEKLSKEISEMSLLDLKSLQNKIDTYFKIWVDDYLHDELKSLEVKKLNLQDKKASLMLDKDIIQNKIDIAKCDKEDGNPVSDRYFYGLTKSLSSKKYELTKVQTEQMRLKKAEDRIKRKIRESSNEKVIDVLAENLRLLKDRDYVADLIMNARVFK